ncbi:MAG: hypothetical protein OEM52_02840 [bacterium]|nr:hypothetical protein [bacterium]
MLLNSLRQSSSSSCSTAEQMRLDREDLLRLKKSEVEFEPVRRLIEIRDAVDQDIRELRIDYPNPSKRMQVRIDELVETRNRIQEEIQVISSEGNKDNE